jgi:hypothetical protein
MTKRVAIDFQELVDELTRSQREPEEGWPVIVSGACESNALLDWLADLDLAALNVRIWCYTDACTIGADMLSRDVQFLKRARLFGKGGDLKIWRSVSNGFRWCYVGLAAHVPEGDNIPWPKDVTNPVFCRKRTALLWGNRSDNQDLWHDDRVAGAGLAYPVAEAAERVHVTYLEYTQAGRPFAIWLQELGGRNE